MVKAQDTAVVRVQDTAVVRAQDTPVVNYLLLSVAVSDGQEDTAVVRAAVVLFLYAAPQAPAAAISSEEYISSRN